MTPHPERLSYVRYALRQGHTVKQLAKMTSIDPWFLYQLKEINDMQLELEKHPMESIPTEVLREAKRMGFSDGRLAGVWRLDGKGAQEKVRHLRKKHGIAAGLQARGHLRRRIRKLHAVPVLDLRRRRRGHAHRQEESHHSGQRAEPHRAGN